MLGFTEPFHRVFNSMKNGFFRAKLTYITKNIWEMGSHIFFHFLYINNENNYYDLLCL